MMNEDAARMRMRPTGTATKTDVEEELIGRRQRCDTVAPLASRLWVPIKNVQAEAHWGAVFRV